MDKLLLTPEDAAEALSLSRSRVYELMVTGLLPSVKIGGSRRVPAEAIRGYVAQLLSEWHAARQRDGVA